MNLRLLEWYSNHLWPYHRLFARGLSRRCSRCALSEKCVQVGASGVCELCAKAPVELQEVLFDAEAANKSFSDYMASWVGKGRRYDAAVMLSGGKDSAYILHRLHKEHPDLRIVCIAVDNGVMDPSALENCQIASDRVGVDLLVLHSHVAAFKDIFKSAFLNIGKRGSYAVVDFADGETIHDLGAATAHALGIPVVLSGLTWVQIDKIFGIRSGFTGADRKGIQIAYPLAAWRTEEGLIKFEVSRLNLLKRGRVSPMATNNTLIFPMVVLDILNIGYCSFEPEFAQLIREGKADLRAWRNAFESLEHGTRSGWLIPHANRALAKIGLTMDEILTAIHKPEKEMST